MLILGIVLGAIAYMQVGYHVVGKHSWRTWQKGKSNGVLPLLLFPRNAIFGKVGWKGSTLIADECEDERSYSLALAFVWPLKLVWNVTILSVFGALMGVIGAVKGALWLGIDAPNALVRKLTGARAPKPALPSVVQALGDMDDIVQELDEAIDTDRKFARLEAREKEKPTE